MKWGHFIVVGIAKIGAAMAIEVSAGVDLNVLVDYIAGHLRRSS